MASTNSACNFTHPCATNDQRTLPRTLLLCTIRNYPNRMNCQIDSSWSHISTNEWYGEFESIIEPTFWVKTA